MKQEIFAYLKDQVGADDNDLLESLYMEYCNTLREKIAAIETCYASGDLAELKRIAHSLKGDTAVVGDNVTHELAVTFEGFVKVGNLEAGKPFFEKLQAICANIEE